MFQLLLAGYHGTKMSSAESILRNHHYNLSNGEKDWLGSGIYFYYEIEDAYNWRDTDAILHSIIRIEDREYLDIQSDEGKELFRKMCEVIYDAQGKQYSQQRDMAQKNQCAVINMVWDNSPEIKVISEEFPSEKNLVITLTDVRPRRREFCVRDNSCIVYTSLIRKDELNG